MGAPTYNCVVPSCGASQSRGDVVRRANVVDPTALNKITGRSMAPNSKAALCLPHYAEHVSGKRVDRTKSSGAIVDVVEGRGVDRIADLATAERTAAGMLTTAVLSTLHKAAEKRARYVDVDALVDAGLDAWIARVAEHIVRTSTVPTDAEQDKITRDVAFSANAGKAGMLWNGGERISREISLDYADADGHVTGFAVDNHLSTLGDSHYVLASGRVVTYAEVDALKAAHPDLWASLTA